MAYPWPGNVRQLHNVVENMVVLTGEETLGVDDLPEEIHSPPAALSEGAYSELAGISIEEAEKQLIRNTLKMLNGNREKAATLLGIGERTLYRKIKEYGLKE
jgi:two-component system response regulator HydG